MSYPTMDEIQSLLQTLFGSSAGGMRPKAIVLHCHWDHRFFDDPLVLSC